MGVCVRAEDYQPEAQTPYNVPSSLDDDVVFFIKRREISSSHTGLEQD